MRALILFAAAAAVLAGSAVGAAQPRTEPTVAAPAPPLGVNPAPLRRPGEGAGPFRKMVIRGAMLIDGTGAPPRGPVDIVVENNRITGIVDAGTPGLPMKQGREPRDFDH